MFLCTSNIQNWNHFFKTYRTMPFCERVETSFQNTSWNFSRQVRKKVQFWSFLRKNYTTKKLSEEVFIEIENTNLKNNRLQPRKIYIFRVSVEKLSCPKMS